MEPVKAAFMIRGCHVSLPIAGLSARAGRLGRRLACPPFSGGESRQSRNRYPALSGQNARAPCLCLRDPACWPGWVMLLQCGMSPVRRGLRLLSVMAVTDGGRCGCRPAGCCDWRRDPRRAQKKADIQGHGCRPSQCCNSRTCCRGRATTPDRSGTTIVAAEPLAAGIYRIRVRGPDGCRLRVVQRKSPAFAGLFRNSG